MQVHSGKRVALSEGIRHVKTKYVLFVDSDTIVPKGGVVRMLSYFDEGIGGVGARIKVRLDKRKLSTYALEFFHRFKEFGFLGLEHFGMPMVLDGECVMYKTSLVKDFMLSREYREGIIFGKKAIYADDRQLTSHVLDMGYKAVRARDVLAITEAPKTVRGVINQAVRWTRAGYLYFFKELLDGTYLRRRSPAYGLQMVYMYMFPLVSLAILALRGLVFVKRGVFGLFFDIFRLMAFIGSPLHSHLHFALLALLAVSTISYLLTFVYIYRFASTLSRRKKRTLAAGGIYLLLLLFISLYGLLTFWRDDWRRPN